MFLPPYPPSVLLGVQGWRRGRRGWGRDEGIAALRSHGRLFRMVKELAHVLAPLLLVLEKTVQSRHGAADDGNVDTEADFRVRELEGDLQEDREGCNDEDGRLRRCAQADEFPVVLADGRRIPEHGDDGEGEDEDVEEEDRETQERGVEVKPGVQHVGIEPQPLARQPRQKHADGCDERRAVQDALLKLQQSQRTEEFRPHGGRIPRSPSPV